MKTKNLVITSIFTALTAIGAFISIPLGNIPISLQTFFVILSGLFLPAKLALFSQVTYMVLGLIGLPIFAGFKGGPQQIFSPSFGFILGFTIASYIISLVFNKLNFSKFSLLFSSTLGTITIYLIGLPYMYYILNFNLNKPMNFAQVFKAGCLIFLPGDLIKLILASVIAYKLIPILKIELKVN